MVGIPPCPVWETMVVVTAPIQSITVVYYIILHTRLPVFTALLCRRSPFHSLVVQSP